ncbi:MAG TPA: GspH/FimT family pseudopilin [Gammaproteobacteria bacterium]|nr:GspH/FimT family pseudopilin [Gammaproteobacteria bacterium]
MTANTANKKGYLLPNLRAFTLIEMLMILVVLMSLLIFVVPAGRDFLGQHRAIAGANRIVGGLYLARSEAVHRGQKIIFCKSVDGKTCGGNWSDGQLILDEKGNVLRRFPALPVQDTLIWNSSAGKDEKVEWLPTGFTNGQRGTFYYCAGHSNATYSQAIVLLNTGRLYVSPIEVQDYAKYCPQG